MILTKRLFLFLFAISFFVACKPNQTGENSGREKAETQEAAKRGSASALNDLPEGIDVAGEFQTALQFGGGNRDKIVIFTLEESGTFFSPDWLSKLHINLFEGNPDNYALRNTVTFSNLSNYSCLNLLSESVKEIEVENGEVFALYSLTDCPDGEDPCTIVTGVINATDKYAISRIDGLPQEKFILSEEEQLASIPYELQQILINESFQVSVPGS